MQLVNTKKIILIAGILFLACITCVHAADHGTDANEPGLFSGSNSYLDNQQTFEWNDGGSLTRTLLSLLLVIGLAVAVMFLSKKVLPKVSAMAGKKVRVLETVSLGSRRAVHLLEVGDRQILIGSTQTTITRLADIPRDAADETVTEETPDESEGAS